MLSRENLEKMGEIAEQCKTCKLGQKPIGPRSGCDIHKKLITDRSEVAWKHIHLFLGSNGGCKSWLPIEANTMKVEHDTNRRLWREDGEISKGERQAW